MSIAARAIHGVNVCVIPSPDNDHRPLALRHRSLATVSAALLGVKALAILTILIAPTPAQLSTITTARIIQLTNKERVKAGLDPLTTNNALTLAAQDKGNNMLDNDYFAHISPTGITPWFWITKYNYDYLVAGENLAIDFVEAEDVVAAWMASPSHKANILHPDYTETGVAVVTGEFQGGTSTIVVHMFGKPAEATESEPVSTPTPSPATAGIQQTVSPTPSPSPTTTSTPAPTLPSPRIALIGNSTVQESVELNVTGTPDTTVHILANGEIVANTQLESDTGNLAVAISSLEDGEITLRAYATGVDNEAQTSNLSNPITVTKDTTGPSLTGDDLSFVIAPAFDTTQTAVTVPQAGGQYIRVFDAISAQTLEAVDELGNKTTLENIRLAPQFDETLTNQELAAPRRMVQLSRRIAAIISAVVLMLLGAAIVIRIRIQHPALITHASFVVLLATILFLV